MRYAGHQHSMLTVDCPVSVPNIFGTSGLNSVNLTGNLACGVAARLSVEDEFFGGIEPSYLLDSDRTWTTESVEAAEPSFLLPEFVWVGGGIGSSCMASSVEAVGTVEPQQCHWMKASREPEAIWFPKVVCWSLPQDSLMAYLHMLLEVHSLAGRHLFAKAPRTEHL